MQGLFLILTESAFFVFLRKVTISELRSRMHSSARSSLASSPHRSLDEMSRPFAISELYYVMSRDNYPPR